MANVGIAEGNAEEISHPSISLLTGHHPGLPNLIKAPMGDDPKMPQIPIGQRTHGLLCPRTRPHIGLAAGEVAAYIQFTRSTFIAVDLRCRPQVGDCPAIRATDWLRPLLFLSFHFMTSNLFLSLFFFLPSLTLLSPVATPNFGDFEAQNGDF